MDFNYTKIKIGNWLFRNAYPLYQLSYFRFKKKNDAEEIRLLRRLIRPGMVVYDIGANIGFYALLLSRLVGEKGRVVCFEPDTVNFSRLEQNTRDNKNVGIFQQAVSDKTGILNIYRSKLLNVDHRTYPVNNYEAVEEVRAVSIDDMLQNRLVPPPDIIKIDIQGYEMSAFRGMQNLLKQAASLKIVAEFWPHGFRRAGTSSLEFFDFFKGAGYHFQMIAEDSLKPLHREFVEKHSEAPFEFSFNVLISKT